MERSDLRALTPATAPGSPPAPAADFEALARRVGRLGAGAAALLLFLIPLGRFLRVAAARFDYPFDLEWMEGGILLHAQRLLTGHPLYTAPSLDFIPFMYPPGYYTLVAAVSRLGGSGYAGARLCSIAATLGRPRQAREASQRTVRRLAAIGASARSTGFIGGRILAPEFPYLLAQAGLRPCFHAAAFSDLLYASQHGLAVDLSALLPAARSGLAGYLRGDLRLPPLLAPAFDRSQAEPFGEDAEGWPPLVGMHDRPQRLVPAQGVKVRPSNHS